MGLGDNIGAMIGILIVLLGFIAIGFLVHDGMSLSQKEECLLDIAKDICEERGMFLKERIDDIIPINFYCIEDERGGEVKEFNFLMRDYEVCEEGRK